MRPTNIQLTAEDKSILESWVRNSKAEQRMVLRARIILQAAEGRKTIEIARALRVRPATVSKWRTRFAKKRLSGLLDAPRSGKPSTYSLETEKRIFYMLDQPPPEGHAKWNGRLLAEALKDVSVH